MENVIKEHLVNLLLEQYKQQCLFDELETKGVKLMDLCVNNLEYVIDIIGFPKDNSAGYDYDHLNSGGQRRDINKKIIDDDFFCRDWIEDRYFEVYRELSSDLRVQITTKGLQLEAGADMKTIKESLNRYIDWLYSELKKVQNGDYD